MIIALLVGEESYSVTEKTLQPALFIIICQPITDEVVIKKVMQ